MQKLYGIVCDIFVAVCHQAQVEEWERKLLVFSRTLDEWLTCQRNWLYLEQIFSTPDIQRWVHPRVAVSWGMTEGGTEHGRVRFSWSFFFVPSGSA